MLYHPIVWALVILLSHLAGFVVEDPVNQLAKGGYSVFHETMVDMPWTDIERSINNDALVLLPIGVVEQHGPHMNCGPDIYQSYLNTKIIKTILQNNGFETLIAPPLYWGIADIGKAFPGNFTVNESTFKLLLNDIFTSLHSWGVRKVVVFDGHGEPRHVEIIREAVLNANINIGIPTYFCVNGNRLGQYENGPYEKYAIPVAYPPQLDIDCRFDNHHADCIETGTMAGFYPELVDTVLARTLLPTNFRGDRKYSSPKDVTEDWYTRAREMTPLGYFGDPAHFDAKKSVHNFYNNSVQEAFAIEMFFARN